MLVVIGFSQHPCESCTWFALRKFCCIILRSSELCTTMAITLLLTMSVIGGELPLEQREGN